MKKIITSLLIFTSISVFAAAPIISYPSGAKVYNAGTAISALTPTNSGGAVSVYATVSTVKAAGGQAITLAFNADGTILYAPLSTGTEAKVNKITMPDTKVALVTSGFTKPFGIAIHPTTGDIYVSDETNSVINKIDPTTGAISLYAGIAGAEGTVNGDVSVAKFGKPQGIAFDESGNLYVAQTNGGALRKISADGSTVSTVGQNTNIEGVITVYLNKPTDLAYFNGFIYVTELGAHKISKVDISTGDATLLAGSGTAAYADGTGAAAKFNSPRGITVDDVTGMLYVGDFGNDRVRKITPAGVVTTISGNGTKGNVDGIGTTTAEHNRPAGVALDGLGNLYVCDAAATSIRKVIVGPYRVSPALPAGLTLNPQTGVISGEPSLVSPATDYTITASNADGSSSHVLNIQIKDIGTDISEKTTAHSITAYSLDHSSIIINGLVSSDATATLYDVRGSIVLEKRLSAGSYNIIQTPTIKSGVYLLSVKNNDSLQRIKIFL